MNAHQAEGLASGRTKRRLSLRIHPDPVLRRPCNPVEEFDTALDDLFVEMLTLMRVHEGIGLAAPQVGLSRQLFVAEIAGQALRLCNPRILSRSGASRLSEGCLSLPGQQATVTRDWDIRVSAYDAKGRKIELGAQALWARVIEHEIDHLNGTLIIDRAEAIMSNRETQQ